MGANSDAAWVYLEPQTDALTGNISYTVPPPPTGSFSFSEGIEADEFGQAGLSLAAEVGVGLAIMAVTGAPITLGGAVVVEGTLLLGSGIAYINEQLSPQEGTYDVRPIEVPQGLVIGSGTDYVVTVSSGSTTIQVMDGSVIFVDQYTNSSVTVDANQMLTLPSGVQAGFSTQELQSDVSAFDASSINQWWVQTVATASPTIAPTIAPTATSNSENGSNTLFEPQIIAALVIAIAIVIIVPIAVVSQRRKKRLVQPNESNTKFGNRNNPPPPPPTNEEKATTYKVPVQPATTVAASFCPNCGKRLNAAKSFCPFCGFNLTAQDAENQTKS